jgi:AcrR family transcriptional regulator
VAAARSAIRQAGQAPPAKLDRRRTDTKERILGAAIALFAAKGYAATTVAEIEAAVGLSPGSGGLYRHFPSKEALLDAVLLGYADRVSKLRASLAKERAGNRAHSTVASDLRRLAEALAEFVTHEEPVIQATAEIGSLPERARRIVAQAWEHAYAMAADVFYEHGVDDRIASTLGVAAIGALNHYATHLGSFGKEPGGIPPGRFARTWISLFEVAARHGCSRHPGEEAAPQLQ